jgi:hypothetical protein
MAAVAAAANITFRIAFSPQKRLTPHGGRLLDGDSLFLSGVTGPPRHADPLSGGVELF